MNFYIHFCATVQSNLDSSVPLPEVSKASRALLTFCGLANICKVLPRSKIMILTDIIFAISLWDCCLKRNLDKNIVDLLYGFLLRWYIERDRGKEEERQGERERKKERKRERGGGERKSGREKERERESVREREIDRESERERVRKRERKDRERERETEGEK